jgi:hypothetical protein
MQELFDKSCIKDNIDNTPGNGIVMIKKGKGWLKQI